MATETGHPVVLRPRGPDIHGSYAHISYATGNEPHAIFISQEATPFLDYLVSHECAHALRMFAVPEKERLLGYADKRHHERAARALVPSIRKLWKNELGERAGQIAAIYHQGIVGQVVNFPADLRIESWLYEQYRDLRPMQATALRVNIEELTIGLDPEVQRTSPALVFRIQNSLNAAYSIFIARLLRDSTLAEPHQQAGFGAIGEKLAEQVWQTRFADYGQDRRDAEDWAKRFWVARWFTWQHYRA
ncbi:MAG: hypothetical protein M1358_08975 [Chloroflexi bacterium]|nr:hypothetical protein [Chloroflexota bacterium]